MPGRMSSFLILLCAVFATACASHYGGRPVAMDDSALCAIRAFPAECTWEDSNFLVRYRIAKTGAPDEYTLEATATYQGSLTWNLFQYASFKVWLVADGAVVGSVSAMIGRGLLEDGLRFKRTFTAQADFDGASITYAVRVLDPEDWPTLLTS